jgi:hypothetical protein
VCRNGGKGRNVLGATNMQAPGMNPAVATAATAAVGGNAVGNPSNATGGPGVADGRTRSMQAGHRTSGNNLSHTAADPGPPSLAQEQSANHVSANNISMQTGGPIPLTLQMMDGHPQSPLLPLAPQSPAGTPRSGLDDIINGTRNSDFHDFLSSLGDHDDVDLGMEF